MRGAIVFGALMRFAGCRESADAPAWVEPVAPPRGASTAVAAPVLADTGGAPAEQPRVTGFPPFVSGEDGLSVTNAKSAEVERPLPIVARTAVAGIVKVLVRYKPFGAVSWATLELQPTKEGFVGEIPCGALSTSGDLKYYVVAVDAASTPLATVGSRKEPLRTSLTTHTDIPLWTLPGRAPSPKCRPLPEPMDPVPDSAGPD
ncbi:MAG: hypothetical protein U0414_28755 [Polyangiaceae bacterium]